MTLTQNKLRQHKSDVKKWTLFRRIIFNCADKVAKNKNITYVESSSKLIFQHQKHPTTKWHRSQRIVTTNRDKKSLTVTDVVKWVKTAIVFRGVFKSNSTIVSKPFMLDACRSPGHRHILYSMLVIVFDVIHCQNVINNIEHVFVHIIPEEFSFFV